MAGQHNFTFKPLTDFETETIHWPTYSVPTCWAYPEHFVIVIAGKTSPRFEANVRFVLTIQTWLLHRCRPISAPSELVFMALLAFFFVWKKEVRHPCHTYWHCYINVASKLRFFQQPPAALLQSSNFGRRLSNNAGTPLCKYSRLPRLRLNRPPFRCSKRHGHQPGLRQRIVCVRIPS